MSKDDRLWMRFPIDIHRDPKVTRLDPAVRWTFIEMNGEARLERNDGVFEKADAEFRWPVDHLVALVQSHPTEPLVLDVDDKYVLRRYALHQFTEADRAALAAKKSAAGKAGAAARWQNSGKPMAGANESHGNRMAGDGKTCQESESESEIEIDDFRTSSQSGLSPVTRARDGDMTDYYETVRQVLMHDAGIPDPSTDEIHAWVTYVASKARTAVKDERAYALGAIDRSPDEVDKWFVKHRRNNLKAVGS